MLVMKLLPGPVVFFEEEDEAVGEAYQRDLSVRVAELLSGPIPDPKDPTQETELTLDPEKDIWPVNVLSLDVDCFLINIECHAYPKRVEAGQRTANAIWRHARVSLPEDVRLGAWLNIGGHTFWASDTSHDDE